MNRLFILDNIEASLRDFQTHFDEINEKLSLHREPFTDTMLDNLLSAYSFVNTLLEKNVDLFSPAGFHSMLELNHLVLCGTDSRTRFEYHKHILETRNRFQKHIKKIHKWISKHFDSVSPYALATGFYCRALSQPQLFIEGNHRTENVILNYLLCVNNEQPMLISSSNAYEYLELSGKIKFTNKDSLSGVMLKLPGHTVTFEELLRTHAHESFLTKREEES